MSYRDNQYRDYDWRREVHAARQRDIEAYTAQNKAELAVVSWLAVIAAVWFIGPVTGIAAWVVVRVSRNVIHRNLDAYRDA